MTEKKEVKDRALKKWLEEFNGTSTRKSYLSALRKFKNNLGIEDLGEYLQSNPDTTADIKRFIVSLNGKPAKTIISYTGTVRVFFTDHNVEIEANGWRRLRRRGFLPRRAIGETRDKAPSKKQLKKILNHLDIKGRASTLFMLSSGARIGETLQLKEEDFDLESNPPKVHIRSDYTKGGVGGRTVYFSFEARDAIKDWLAKKPTLTKKNQTHYSDDDRVFCWSKSTNYFMWNNACNRAGLGERDTKTGRRVYHIHSLRKFFRTKIGLNLDVTNALLGHSEYLDSSYLRLDEKGEIAREYLGAMPNVSVYDLQNTKLEEKTLNLEEDNQKLKDEVANLKGEMRNMQSMMRQILNKLPEGN